MERRRRHDRRRGGGGGGGGKQRAGGRLPERCTHGAGEFGTRAILPPPPPPPPLHLQPRSANKNVKVARIGVVNGAAHAVARGTAGARNVPRRKKVFAACASRARRFFYRRRALGSQF